jgi:hypothetical protein
MPGSACTSAGSLCSPLGFEEFSGIDIYDGQ